MYFDSHCHLTDPQFAADLERVLERAVTAAVTRMVSICSDAADAQAALELTRKHEGVWSTAGIHPHAAAAARPGDLERIAELLAESKVVAVGETGLDYHYDNSPRVVQRKLLEQHVQLASDLDLPLVVHSREADEDTIAMLRSVEGMVRGVLHCFAGGAQLLDAGIEAGWMISFSGLITFKNWDGQDLLREVPHEQILIETDSPYLAPVPNRGKRNEPALVREVGAFAARLYGMEPEELAVITTANALRFYQLDSNSAELTVTPEAER